MSSGKTVTLRSGHKIPQLGYGTWQSSPGEVSVGVYEAIKAGYRHLDFAKIYENQREVAQGIKKAFAEFPDLKREDFFITSKLWNHKHRPENVEAALDDTLEELGLDYLDLYLVHWPIAFPNGDELYPPVKGKEGKEVQIDDGVSIVDTWRAMTKLPKSKARTVGVSNHTVKHLQTIIDATGEIPAVNQVERHPRLQQEELLAYMREKNIHLTAYSAFGNNAEDLPLLVFHPEIKKIADKIGATGAQVILAWSQIGGQSVIPKSVKPARIVENFKEVELSPEDVKAIEAIGKDTKRMNIPINYNPMWNVNLFNEAVEAKGCHQIILGA